MSTIFAMNGAGFGTNFGAAVYPSIMALQNVMVAFGRMVGSAQLAAVSVDGQMGSQTQKAVNWAMTQHLGAGQAPADLRTGNLAQDDILDRAEELTALITKEGLRRSSAFIVPALQKTSTGKVVRVTPATPTKPAVVEPVAEPTAAGFAMSSIMKWSALGFGFVVLAGAGYYYYSRKRRAVPAIAGLGWVDRDKSGRVRLDNREREQWIQNDESLYNWYKSETRRGRSMRDFIKRNRTEIDTAIRRVLDRKPGE